MVHNFDGRVISGLPLLRGRRESRVLSQDEATVRYLNQHTRGVSLYVSLSDNLDEALFPPFDCVARFQLEIMALIDSDNTAE